MESLGPKLLTNYLQTSHWLISLAHAQCLLALSVHARVVKVDMRGDSWGFGMRAVLKDEDVVRCGPALTDGRGGWGLLDARV